jgi:hypothetical protein
MYIHLIKTRSKSDDILDPAILANYQSQLATRLRIDPVPEDFCVKLVCGIVCNGQ